MKINKLDNDISFIYNSYINGNYKIEIDSADTVAFADCVFFMLSNIIKEKTLFIKNCLSQIKFNPKDEFKNYSFLLPISYNSSTLEYEEIMYFLTERISIEVNDYYYSEVDFRFLKEYDEIFVDLIKSYKSNTLSCINNIKKNRSIFIKNKEFLPFQYHKVFDMAFN